MSDVVHIGITFKHSGHIAFSFRFRFTPSGVGLKHSFSANVLSAGRIIEENDDGLTTRRGLGGDCEEEGSQGKEHTEQHSRTHREGEKGERKRKRREEDRKEMRGVESGSEEREIWKVRD